MKKAAYDRWSKGISLQKLQEQAGHGSPSRVYNCKTDGQLGSLLKIKAGQLTKAHLSCFWWGRTVVRTVGSQEQVCIWEITPFKTVMSTRIKKKKPFLASLEMYTCGNLERLDRFLFSRPFIGKLIIATVRSTLSFRERQLAVWNQNAALLGTGKTMIVVLMQENVLSTVQLMMSQTAQMDEKEAGSALIWVWRT